MIGAQLKSAETVFKYAELEVIYHLLKLELDWRKNSKHLTTLSKKEINPHADTEEAVLLYRFMF